jgi:hypothetical protein
MRTYKGAIMFNRALQVKVIKTKKVDPEEVKADKQDFYNKTEYISFKVQKLTRSIALGVAGYIVLDTFRQAVIEQAKK